MLQIKKTPNDISQFKQDDDEILIFLQPPESPFYTEIKNQSFDSLYKKLGPLRIYAGFRGEKGAKPFILCEWKDFEGSLLELRWYFCNYIQSIKKDYKVKSLSLMIDSKSAYINQARVLAEDAYTMLIRPLDQKLSVFQKINLVTDLSEQVIDSHRIIRKLDYMGWVNENPDELTSLEIGSRLAKFAGHHDCDFQVYEEDQLKNLGLNLLVAVGQASQKSPSRLFVVTKNLHMKKKPLMLVGKGITFDTGGVNVKPFAGHVNAMKNDMGGAALMCQTFMSLVEQSYSEPIVLVIPACENLVAQNSMKPGAVVRSHRGYDVIVEHTDAEGRLILADAISYGESLFDPKLTLCAATLTTAALRQYTNYYTPVHFAPATFAKALQKSADQFGEKFIFCEEFAPFYAANQARLGDLTNMGRLPSHANVGGGSSVAAHFLKRFSKTSFIHFDIFASAWNWSGDYPGSRFGATGAVFHSLVDCLRESKWN